MSGTLEERLAEVLSSHRLVAEIGLIGGRWTCSCGSWSLGAFADRVKKHDAHLADVAAQEVREFVAERERAAEVRALRGVADDILRGTFTVEQYARVAGLANAIRGRANRIEGGEQP